MTTTNSRPVPGGFDYRPVSRPYRGEQMPTLGSKRADAEYEAWRQGMILRVYGPQSGPIATARGRAVHNG